METIFLAIVTDDREYGKALSLAMLSVCRNFIIKIFKAEEFFENRCRADLILWDGEEARSSYGGKIVYLAEKSSDVRSSPSGKKFCIYKYGAAIGIVASVFEIYEALTGRHAVNLKQQEVRLFACASAAGGMGCTTIAMALGQELCRFHGKRTLYLSLEEIESTGAYFKHAKEAKGAGVYLYQLFKQSAMHWVENSLADVNAPFLEGYIVKDDYGLEAFAPTQGRNPLRELNPEELHKFIAALIDIGRYDVILMDLGSWLDQSGIACLKLAERICFVAACQGISAGIGDREEQYISHICNHCGSKINKKIIKVCNPVSKGGARQEKREGEKPGAVPSMDISRCHTMALDGNVRKIMLEGAFGNEVRLLAEKMMEPILKEDAR